MGNGHWSERALRDLTQDWRSWRTSIPTYPFLSPKQFCGLTPLGVQKAIDTSSERSDLPTDISVIGHLHSASHFFFKEIALVLLWSASLLGLTSWRFVQEVCGLPPNIQYKYPDTCLHQEFEVRVVYIARPSLSDSQKLININRNKL
jgi:hypothetical protein